MENCFRLKQNIWLVRDWFYVSYWRQNPSFPLVEFLFVIGKSADDCWWVRIPDLVVYPASQEQVEMLVQLAMEMDLVIIPFGGGIETDNTVVSFEVLYKL